MAVLIDELLTVSPGATRLPSGAMELTQTVHSDLGGEHADIVYSLDGRSNVMFVTPEGLSKTVTISQVAIPGVPTVRIDTVQLGEIRGGTGLDQLEIDQLITAENRARDSVNVVILGDPA